METTKSTDGTVIAYERTAEGPRLIVAVGAFCDRLEALAHTLPYDIALAGGQGAPASLSAIAMPVLVLGGGISPEWFHRTVQETAAFIPGARLVMMEATTTACHPK